MYKTHNDNPRAEKDTYICEITTKKVSIDETGIITVYGINMYNRNKNLSELENEHCCVDDISDDLEKVKRLRGLLIECDVYPVHLKEIVEDFLSLN